jgi:hypothetical protein
MTKIRIRTKGHSSKALTNGLYKLLDALVFHFLVDALLGHNSLLSRDPSAVIPWYVYAYEVYLFFLIKH